MDRWLAFASGYTTGEPDYCGAYFSYERRDPLQLSDTYTPTLLPATQSQSLKNGVHRLTNEYHGDYTAEAGVRTGLSGDPAIDQINKVAQGWFPGSWKWGVDARR